MAEQKKQYALVKQDGSIEALILTRGSEFYCYERLETPLRTSKRHRRYIQSAGWLKWKCRRRKRRSSKIGRPKHPCPR